MAVITIDYTFGIAFLNRLLHMVKYALQKIASNIHCATSS